MSNAKGGEPPSYSSHMSGFTPAPTAEPHFSQPGAYPAAFNANYSVVQVPTPMLRSAPVRLTCPYCKSDVITKVEYESGLLSHLAAGLLCLIGCWLCFYIPYVVDGMKNAIHGCPHCGRCIGEFKRM